MVHILPTAVNIQLYGTQGFMIITAKVYQCTLLFTH